LTEHGWRKGQNGIYGDSEVLFNYFYTEERKMSRFSKVLLVLFLIMKIAINCSNSDLMRVGLLNLKK